MEISSICTALEYTLLNDKEKRDNAAAYLYQAETQTGFPTILLQIVAGDAPDYIKLAAAIQLKNVIRKRWRKPEEKEESAAPADTFVLAESDKAFVRAGIFQIMTRCTTKQVLAQIKTCLQYVADYDFPDAWPTLLAEVKASLINPVDQKTLYAGLTAAAILTKLFKYQLSEKQAPIEPLIDEIYEVLYQLALKLIPTQTEESAVFLALIGKAILASIYMGVCNHMLSEGSLENWLVVLKAMFEWPVPSPLTSPTEDEEEVVSRGKSAIFKVKDIAALAFYRLIQKYGNSKACEKRYLGFCKKVEENFSLGLLELFIAFIKVSHTVYVKPSTLVTAFRFLSQSIRNPHTSKKIQPLLPELLNNHAFPKLLITKAVAKAWDEDPVAFIKDFLEDSLYETDPRYAAWVLIDTACSHKGYAIFKGKKVQSHPILEGFLAFIGTAIQEGTKNANPRLFDAALYAIGKLKIEIELYPHLLGQMEVLLTQYVLPNLDHPLGLIRTRCCHMFYEFSSISFSNSSAMQAASEKLVALMKDKDLPVRVVAALAISRFLEKPAVCEKLRSFALELISVYLMLISQVGIEELVGALDNVIKEFDKEMRDYSVELIKELVKVYTKISEQSKEEGGPQLDLTDTKMAAAACIQTMQRVINIIGDDKEKLSQTEDLLIPIIAHEIKRQELEVLESCVEIAIQYTYYSRTISKLLWGVYPVLLETFVGTSDKDCGWGYEIPKESTVVLQNFITKDPDTFCTQGNENVKYIDMMLIFVKKVVEISKKNRAEIDAIYAIKILISMLEALKGKIDNYFEGIIGLILSELNVARVDEYKSILIQAIAMCCWHSLEKTMGLIEASKLTEAVFKTMFAYAQKFTKDYQMRRTLYGLVTILEEPRKIPSVLQCGLKEIFKVVVDLCDKLVTINEKESDSSSSYSDAQEEDRGILASMGEDKKEEDEEDSDSSFKLSEADFPLGGDLDMYYNPLDSVHELFYVKSRLEEIAKKDLSYYKELEAALTEEEKKKLFNAMNKGEEYQKNLIEDRAKHYN